MYPASSHSWISVRQVEGWRVYPASSHRKAKHCGAGSCTRSTCGSWLARESGRPVTHELTEPPPSRASPLPHLDLCASGRGVACVLGQRWELACLRCHQPGGPGTPRCLHRRQARSHHKAALLVLAPLKSATERKQGATHTQHASIIRSRTAPPSRSNPLPGAIVRGWRRWSGWRRLPTESPGRGC